MPTIAPPGPLVARRCLNSSLGMLLSVVAIVSCTAPAVFSGAVSHWTQRNAADFKPGTFHNVVVNNLGDLKLSRSVHSLLEQDPRLTAVYSLAQTADGTVYAGTGPQGVILAIDPAEKVSTAATIDGATGVFSLLAMPDGSLLAGTGGAKGRVYRIAKKGAKPEQIFDGDGGVQYVWALASTNDGTVYAATGPNGQLFELRANGTHTAVLESSENNLLSLVGDGKDTLYIGTDPDGLVYKFSRKTGRAVVMYDATETEVSALALDESGNLYAGTAESVDASATTDSASDADAAGRPDGSGGGVPISSPPSKTPAPPVPNPNPGEPNPVPREAATGLQSVKKFVVLADDPAIPGEPSPPPDPMPPASPVEGGGKTGAAPAPPQQAINAAETGKPRPDGNAIYKIDPQGFVTEVFRQPVLVLGLAVSHRKLLVATGSTGLVYELDPAAGESSVVAKVDPKQVACLLPTRDGRIVLGLANAGGIATLGAAYAGSGTYVSDVLDADQISRFGKVRLHGSLPGRTTLTVATRSGNVRKTERAGDTADDQTTPATRPAAATTATSRTTATRTAATKAIKAESGDDDIEGWNPWSSERPATEFVSTDSPPARFFQYRLTFKTDDAQASASHQRSRRRIPDAEHAAGDQERESDARQQVRPAAAGGF